MGSIDVDGGRIGRKEVWHGTSVAWHGAGMAWHGRLKARRVDDVSSCQACQVWRLLHHVVWHGQTRHGRDPGRSEIRIGDSAYGSFPRIRGQRIYYYRYTNYLAYGEEEESVAHFP